MEISTIMVHVDASRTVEARLSHAVALAQSFNATLIGLLSLSADQPAWVYHATDGGRERHVFELDLGAACEAARQAFDLATEAATFSVDWRVGEGAPRDAIQCEGRLADLLIVGRPEYEEPDTDVARHFVETAILSSGRPVLVVPQGPLQGASAFPYGAVVVAWSGTRESARALHDALPLLRRAAQVDVVSCIPPDLRCHAAISPPAYATTWLARHGVHAAMIELELERTADTGQALLSVATQRGADLLVCGAYGRGPLCEAWLGGVTDTVLRQATMPILFSC